MKDPGFPSFSFPKFLFFILKYPILHFQTLKTEKIVLEISQEQASQTQPLATFFPFWAFIYVCGIFPSGLERWLSS